MGGEPEAVAGVDQQPGGGIDVGGGPPLLGGVSGSRSGGGEQRRDDGEDEQRDRGARPAAAAQCSLISWPSLSVCASSFGLSRSIRLIEMSNSSAIEVSESPASTT